MEPFHFLGSLCPMLSFALGMNSTATCFIQRRVMECARMLKLMRLRRDDVYAD
jgi:hypothetical protein